MLDFPNNPVADQIFTSGGASWIFDGTKWTITGASGAILPEAPQDGTLYGRENAAWTRATNFHYRNRIINGDMSVDQRHGGSWVAVTTTMYIIDRWNCQVSIASIGNAGQYAQGAAGISATGQLYNFGWTTTTAHSVVAGDVFLLQQWIEGANFNDTNWGTANALPVTLEFWVVSSLSGTFAGSLRNGAGNRSYVFTYSIPTAGTWAKIRINIPGDQVGTWSVAGNAAAASLAFNLGVGATYQTPANAWTAGNFISAPGAVSVVGTLNATFNITGVALMVGAPAANAEPEFKSYADNLLDCQRYFVKPNFATQIDAYATAASQVFNRMWTAPVVLRGTPITFTSALTGGTNYTAGSTTFGVLADNRTVWVQMTNTAIGIAYGTWTITSLDADF